MVLANEIMAYILLHTVENNDFEFTVRKVSRYTGKCYGRVAQVLKLFVDYGYIEKHYKPKYNMKYYKLTKQKYDDYYKTPYLWFVNFLNTEFKNGKK